MKIGAHVSIKDRLDLAIDRAVGIGADCIQIFGSAPQSWQVFSFPEEQVKAFREKAQKHRIGPVFLHGIYLLNLASENPSILGRSIDSLTQYLKFAEAIGAQGVVFHAGSHKGRGFKKVRDQIVSSIDQILSQSSKGPILIVENASGGGGKVGSDFSELGKLISAVKDPRLKICLDTAHAFTAGYGIKTKEGLEQVLGDFEKEIGLAHLAIVHANDSKSPLFSGLDRHENIGDGYIGLEGFRNILNHLALKHLPFVIETPGFDRLGPDQRNISILRSLTLP